jgi:hypothetical protein
VDAFTQALIDALDQCTSNDYVVVGEDCVPAAG